MRKSEVRKKGRLEDEKITTSEPLSLPASSILSVLHQKSRILPYACLLLLAFLAVGCASSQIKEESSIDLVWPKPPDTARVRFIKSVSNSEDIAGTEEGAWIKRAWKFLTGARSEKELISPYGISVDNQGTVYVADRDARDIFSFNLQLRKSSVMLNESDDIEDYPIGVGLADNNIYVSYPNTSRVLEFSRSGKIINEIGKGLLQRPTGVAANSDRGLLYVVDTLGHDVKAFDLKGKLLFTFGKRGDKDGELNYPTHIFTARDIVYIADELNFRVQAFTFDGKFLFKFGKLGTVPGTLQSLKGIAVDSDDNIYVADAVADIIQVFDRQGRLLLLFGGNGTERGKFKAPAGIFIDINDRIYITDLFNRRVQVFQYLKAAE